MTETDIKAIAYGNNRYNLRDPSKYAKPSAGIPQTDLEQTVQNKLDKSVVISPTQPTETENKLWVEDGALYYKDSQGNYQRILSGADMTGYRTASDQDVIDAGKEAAGLGLTGASVGDFVRVNAVDANGKPTSWRPVPLSKFRCNKNFLDNWYFVGGGSQLGDGVFPINQRGQTTYSGAGYGIDRWKSQSSINCTLTSDYITIGMNQNYTNFYQDISNDLSGKTITASCLTSDGLISTTFVASEQEATIKIFTSAGGTSIYLRVLVTDGKTRFAFFAGTGASGELVSFNVIAVKIELGSEQTLANNEGTEENPVWALNEIPDYGEELRKCQTSRADSADAYANQEIATINRNPGAHNSIYRGKYLGSTVTAAQYAAISAGTFDDLFIGDYWTINNVNWRIAAFDYWLRTGDKNWNDGNGNYNVSFETTHHIVIVPDTNLYSAQMHNTTSGAYTEGADNNPTTGAYIGSDMYTTNLARAKTIVNDAFGAAHVLNHREHLQNAATNGYSTGGAWYDSTVDLMNEQMVYGCRVFGNVLNGTNWPNLYTNSKSQLPLFALEPSRICNRAAWWLRGVASSADFAVVSSNGNANASASSDPLGVRPAFGIKA